MATGTVSLALQAAQPSDGSSGNAAPQPLTKQGTESNPKKHYRVYAFDAATAEYVTFSFRMPANYASGGALKIEWSANAITATAVVWAAKVSAVTAGDVDTRLEHASAAAASVTSNTDTAEANRIKEASITLTMDSAAAGDVIDLVFFRDAANGSDTLAVDAALELLDFEYTTT